MKKLSIVAALLFAFGTVTIAQDAAKSDKKADTKKTDAKKSDKKADTKKADTKKADKKDMK